MPNNIDKYKELLAKVKGDQALLADLSPEADMSVELSPEEMISQELDSQKSGLDLAKKYLATEKSKASINKLARANDDDENSAFNLGGKFDNPDDIYDDVTGQLGIQAKGLTPDELADSSVSTPELSVSGQPALTPAELAQMSPEPVRSPAQAPIAPIAPASPANAPQDPIALPQVPVTPEAPVDPLAEAFKQKRNMDALAMITEGLGKAGAGMAGGRGAVLKSGVSGKNLRDMGKDIAEEAKLKVSQGKKARINALNERYKLAQIAKLETEATGGTTSKDPKSDESKVAQEQTMNMMGSMGIEFDPEKIGKLNAATLGSKQFTAALRKSVNKLSKQRLDSTNTERFNKWTEKKEDDLVKSVDKFNKDKEVVRANSMISGANIAKDMVESGNPIAAASIPNFLARASGEVGALTEADKEPFGGTRAIVERAKQSVEEMAKGTLTEANAKFVLELAEVYKKTANSVKSTRADLMAGQLGGIDFPIEMLRGRFMGTDRTKLAEQVLPEATKMKSLTGAAMLDKISKPQEDQVNEVRRKSKDGRTAVFNADTKEFIRYE